MRAMTTLLLQSSCGIKKRGNGGEGLTDLRGPLRIDRQKALLNLYFRHYRKGVPHLMKKGEEVEKGKRRAGKDHAMVVEAALIHTGLTWGSTRKESPPGPTTKR